MLCLGTSVPIGIGEHSESPPCGDSQPEIKNRHYPNSRLFVPTVTVTIMTLASGDSGSGFTVPGQDSRLRVSGSPNRGTHADH
eukprot:3330344-Rhodomonas_salina.1